MSRNPRVEQSLSSQVDAVVFWRSVGTMIGRERDVARVRDAVRRTGRCALVGPGGVGKSTVIASIVTSFPDRALIVDAMTADRAEGVMARVSELLDVDHEIDMRHGQVDQSCADLADRLAAAGVELLVIDHAEKHGEGLLVMLALINDHAPSIAILVASRNQPAQPFGETVRLKPLSLEPSGDDLHPTSVVLFRDVYRRSGGEMNAFDRDPQAVLRAVSATGGLPLAICVAGAQAALIGLEAASPSATQLAGSDPVGQVLERSLSDLDAECLEVFEAISSLRSSMTIHQIGAICGISSAETIIQIERLARRSLVDVADGRVHMLPPIRQLAQRHAIQNGRWARRVQQRDAWALVMCQADPAPTTTAVVRVEDDLLDAISSALTAGHLSTAMVIATVLDDALRSDLRHMRRLNALEPVLAACLAAGPDEVGIDDVIELLRLTAMARADAQGAAAAAPLLDEAMARANSSPTGSRHTARLESLRAGLAFEAGDLQAARAAASASIHAGTQANDQLAVLKSMKLYADIELEAGDLDQSVQYANDVISSAPPSLQWLRSYAFATVAACDLERGAIVSVLTAARRIWQDAVRVGDLDLVVEADWLTAMADPFHAPIGVHQLVGDRVGNSVIHIQADIARALRQLAAGNHQTAITLAADCELRACALPMHPAALDAQLLVGESALQLGERAEATRAFRQVLIDAVSHNNRLRVPDALDGLAAVLDMAMDPHADACRASASALRSYLGVVARPHPWRNEPTRTSIPPPERWIEAGDLTDVGLAEVLETIARAKVPATAEASRLDALSPAERGVADLVAQGCSNREIGERLFVSRRTVESHITHAFQKLGVTSRTQLAALVFTSRQ